MASTMWMKENLNYLPPTVKLVLLAIVLYPVRLPFLGLVFLHSEVAFTEGKGDCLRIISLDYLPYSEFQTLFF